VDLVEIPIESAIAPLEFAFLGESRCTVGCRRRAQPPAAPFCVVTTIGIRVVPDGAVCDAWEAAVRSEDLVTATGGTKGAW